MPLLGSTHSLDCLPFPSCLGLILCSNLAACYLMHHRLMFYMSYMTYDSGHRRQLIDWCVCVPCLYCPAPVRTNSVSSTKPLISLLWTVSLQSECLLGRIIRRLSITQQLSVHSESAWRSSAKKQERLIAINLAGFVWRTCHSRCNICCFLELSNRYKVKTSQRLISKRPSGWCQVHY